MPSVSKAQQRFMGLVHAYKKGDIPASQVSKAVKDAAKSMKKKSAKDFASTKHNDLPNKVREYLMSENPAASAAAAMAMMKLQNPSTGQKVSAVTPLRDKDHPLHKKSKSIFQRLKDKFMKKNESINEDGHTDVASIERKLKLIVQDANDVINALKSKSNEDSLPSWWTDKITLAKDYVGKSRDFIMNPTESVNEESKTIKSIQNLADKNKYGTVSGTRMNGKTAKEIIAIYNHPKMKSFRGKMDKMKSHELMDLTIRLPKMLGIKVESVNEKTVSIGGEDLMKYLMKRFKMSKSQAIASMKKHKMDMSFLKKESVNEKVIKVSKKDDIPGNPMKMKGEEKIKKLTYSGSVGMDKPGSYEIKGNKLNVNNIRPRDKGFFVRHFTMGTGFRKANLYYDGVHWQGGKKF